MERLRKSKLQLSVNHKYGSMLKFHKIIGWSYDKLYRILTYESTVSFQDAAKLCYYLDIKTIEEARRLFDGR